MLMSLVWCQLVKKVLYFLEVDLEYPDELHEIQNDYPLAPEKFAVSSDMLKRILMLNCCLLTQRVLLIK